MRFVLMGVSGSGKTTIGLRLSDFSGYSIFFLPEGIKNFNSNRSFLDVIALTLVSQ